MQEQPEIAVRRGRKRGYRGTLFTSTPENAASREARIRAHIDRVQRELLDHPEQERESLRYRRER